MIAGRKPGRKPGPVQGPVSCDKLNHRRYDDAALRELGFRLGLDRSQVRARGHDWDVADILAVVEVWQDEQGESPRSDDEAT